MSGEAKGQVGGLDMNEASRKSLADESRAWTCPTCAKSNLAIIKECEEEWKEMHADGADSAKSDENEIPAELRLAYRDDMERGPPTPMPGTSTDAHVEIPASPVSPATPRTPSHLIPHSRPQSLHPGRASNALARPKPPPSPLRATAIPDHVEEKRHLRSNGAEIQSSSSSLDVPGSAPQSSSADIRTHDVPSTPQIVVTRPPTSTADGRRSWSDEATPLWMDYTIVGLGIMLFIMLIKKLFAS